MKTYMKYSMSRIPSVRRYRAFAADCRRLAQARHSSCSSATARPRRAASARTLGAEKADPPSAAPEGFPLAASGAARTLGYNLRLKVLPIASRRFFSIMFFVLCKFFVLNF